VQLIDRQADRLLREVKVARQQREDEVSRRKQDVQHDRLTLINFQQYSEQVKDKGALHVPNRKLLCICLFIYVSFIFALACISVSSSDGFLIFISSLFSSDSFRSTLILENKFVKNCKFNTHKIIHVFISMHA